MAEFIEDCPLCAAVNTGFDVFGDYGSRTSTGNWMVQAFSKCRACDKASVAIFMPSQNHQSSPERLAQQGYMTSITGSIDSAYKFMRFAGFADVTPKDAPQFLPDSVANCYREGAAAFAIGCFNASAAMFRLSLDLASKDLLPDQPAEAGGPNAIQRKRLFDRLNYLFDNGILPSDLRELAECVREDGNDGAHDGTMKKEDAEDLTDFASELLERAYTEPGRLRLAKARREARRAAAP